MSRCWWIWMTDPSVPSALKPSSCRRSASTAELLFHGGGPVWRPGMLAHGMTLELVADLLPPPRVRTMPRTTASTTTTATSPPISHVRSIWRGAFEPFERTGGAGLRDGGGPRPALRRADAFAIGAER